MPKYDRNTQTLLVRNTSGYEFSFGVGYSWLEAPEWTTSTETENGVPVRRARKTTDGRDLAPVLFASFLWCEQPSDRQLWARACRDGSRGPKRWLPRVVVGLPISSDLGRGSAYAGASLPYVRYVAIIGGVHLRRVKELRRPAADEGIVDGDAVPTSDVLKVGPFVSLAVTEEIFGLILPRLEPAK